MPLWVLVPLGLINWAYVPFNGLSCLIRWGGTPKSQISKSPGSFFDRVAFGTPIVLYICGAVLYLKFGLKRCSLNNSADNQWGFGQYLVLVMTFAPFLSVLEDFLSTSYYVRVS